MISIEDIIRERGDLHAELATLKAKVREFLDTANQLGLTMPDGGCAIQRNIELRKQLRELCK